jgi:hypothetical protein
VYFSVQSCSTAKFSTAKRPFNPLHHLVFAQNFEEVVEARAGRVAGAGEADGMDEHAGFHAKFGWSRRFWRLNVFNAGDMQNGTASCFQNETFGVLVQPDFNGISENPCGVMVLNVVSLPIRHFDSERSERLFLHSFLELIRVSIFDFS